MNEYPAWLVFWGTLTTIVRAPDEASAYSAFIAAHFPKRQGSRITPPRLNEVKIRRPRESDRGWIVDSGEMAFVALLAELEQRAATP